MTIKYLNKLDELKALEPNREYLIGLKINTMVKICKAWLAADAKIRMEHFNGDNIWDCICIDFDKFSMDMGPFNVEDLFKMIKANVLYPDGTIAYDWLEENYAMALATIMLDKTTKENQI